MAGGIIATGKELLMKKMDVVNLIQHHVNRDDLAFRAEAYNIAKDFDRSGDSDLAGYVLSLLSSVGTFSPQSYDLILSSSQKFQKQKGTCRYRMPYQAILRA